MRLNPRPLLLVDLTPEASGLFGALPEARYQPRAVRSEELEAVLARAEPSAMVVVQPIDGGSPAGTLDQVDRVLDLLKSEKRIPVVGLFHHPENNGEIVASLLRAGLAEWIDLSREASAWAVEMRLRHVAGIAVQRLLERALPSPVPSRTRRLLGVAAEVVADGGQMPELAEALGIAERTLSGWCARADLPPPRRLLAWLRLLMVGDYLDSGRRTFESIARATGYSSAASLKTALRNMLGATPRELRAAGAFSTVTEHFRAELRALREEGHARGRPAKTWLS